jgi:hypothetical protein
METGPSTADALSPPPSTSSPPARRGRPATAWGETDGARPAVQGRRRTQQTGLSILRHLVTRLPSSFSYDFVASEVSENPGLIVCVVCNASLEKTMFELDSKARARAPQTHLVYTSISFDAETVRPAMTQCHMTKPQLSLLVRTHTYHVRI